MVILGLRKEKGGQVALCCAKPIIDKTFRIMGLDEQAEIFATQDEALDVDWHRPESILGGGTIFGEATTSEIGVMGESLGAAVGDIDNDGDLDLFAATTSGRGPSEAFLRERSTLFLNLGEGAFLDVTEGIGLKSLNASNTFFGRFFDFDNDADVDLFPGFGSFFFENVGDLEPLFIERTFQSGLSGVSGLADYDGDGFVDIAFFGQVYRNQAMPQAANGEAVERPDNNYLYIDLVGVESNRDGLGARVFATADGLRQMRELISADGWVQDELRLHFGLGERTSVDQLEIRWPSGQVDFIDDIPTDQSIRVVEGRGEWYPALRTVWDVPPPAVVEFDQTLNLRAVVRPALFEPSATIASITADLSGLGGPQAVPLVDQEDGTYLLEAEFVVGGTSVLRDVEVFIEQETTLGLQWINLSRDIAVSGDPNTAILEEYAAGRPESFALAQNYPNPFNAGTVFRFALPADADIDLSLYNLAGQQVATLVKGRRAGGTYTVRWDGHDDDGRALASGVYLYRLQVGMQVETRKLVLLR